MHCLRLPPLPTRCVRADNACHARGAKILVITNPWFSQAAEVADLVLPVTFDGLGPFDSVVPATAIVESLVAGKLGKPGKRADRRIREAMSWPRALWSTAHVPFPAEIALVLARRAEGRCVGWRLETRSVQCAKSVVPMDCSWVTSAGGRTSTRWNHDRSRQVNGQCSTEERHRRAGKVGADRGARTLSSPADSCPAGRLAGIA